MALIKVDAYAVECNGCGRRLGQGHGGTELHEDRLEAIAAILDAGWTIHPDGATYCPQEI